MHKPAASGRLDPPCRICSSPPCILEDKKPQMIRGRPGVSPWLCVGTTWRHAWHGALPDLGWQLNWLHSFSHVRPHEMSAYLVSGWRYLCCEEEADGRSLSIEYPPLRVLAEVSEVVLRWRGVIAAIEHPLPGCTGDCHG